MTDITFTTAQAQAMPKQSNVFPRQIIAIALFLNIIKNKPYFFNPSVYELGGVLTEKTLKLEINHLDAEDRSGYNLL